MIIVARPLDQYSGVICGREPGCREGIIAASHHLSVSFSPHAFPFKQAASEAAKNNCTFYRKIKTNRCDLKMINGLRK